MAAAATSAGGVTWSRNPSALWRATVEEVVLLAPQGDPVIVNGPGAALWELLEEPAPLDVLCQELSEVYGVDEDTVRAAVEPLLHQLEEADLARRGA